MLEQLIAELFEAVDKNCQKFQEVEYMEMMRLFQEIHKLPKQKEIIKYLPYGATANALSMENDRLKMNIQRLKRSHKNKRSQWKTLEEQLRGQINELLNEIEYLEQFKNVKPLENNLKDHIKNNI